jgi:hypothetical protein
MVGHFLKTTLVALVFLFASLEASEISIDRIQNAKSGERKTVVVRADNIAAQISSFNLLIAFDQSLSFVLQARPGDLHKNHGWEYFTYRLISRDTVSAHMPGYNVHLINVIGIASLSGNTPQQITGQSFVLTEIDVILATMIGSFSDETWTPFSFFWRDCNDNVLTSLGGDTIYTANALFENMSDFEPRFPVSFEFPGYGHSTSTCPPPQNEEVVQRVEYVNSGIWSFVIDPAEECLNGDVNLNGIPFEVSDLVLFIDFFIYGIPILPWPPQASIDQTDCNCDSMVLSVADVVCFIRKVLNYESAGKIPVSAYDSPVVLLEKDSNNSKMNLHVVTDVALVYLRINSASNSTINNEDFIFSHRAHRSGQIGDTITMMLIDLQGNPVLNAGEHKLFEYTGSAELEIAAWFVDMAGNESSFKLENAVLPENPELLQNYPNPFNPSTTIEFNLPANSNWQLEIYNIAGQLIRNYSGISSGLTKVNWDGSNSLGIKVASGVYFYKLVSNDITTTRKMLLLK